MAVGGFTSARPVPASRPSALRVPARPRAARVRLIQGFGQRSIPQRMPRRPASSSVTSTGAPLDSLPAVEGLIHSTESFSAVDGPGVRFIVFTQGCGMRCLFCSNPDTQLVDGSVGSHVTSKDIAAQLRRVAPYLRPNGGGVTCSGGEPLLQPEFVAAVFKEAHALGLTTCLDTTGQGTKHHNWDKVLPHTDLVLFCIKHLDPQRYLDITGLHQAGALAFVRELAARRTPFWLRYVLTPGYTDDPADLQALIEFCRKQPSLLGVELLPFHQLGREKWRTLGWDYSAMEAVEPPTHQQVEAAVQQLEAGGLRVICDVQRVAPRPS